MSVTRSDLVAVTVFLSLSLPLSQSVTRSDSPACYGAGRMEQEPQAESHWDVRVLEQLVGVC